MSWKGRTFSFSPGTWEHLKIFLNLKIQPVGGTDF